MSTKLPISKPSSEYCVPPKRGEAFASLSEADKYAEVIKHFDSEGYAVGISEKSAEKRALEDDEKMFLSQETILRFLRATKWNVAAAIKRIEGCLVWRRTHNLNDIRAAYEFIAPECESGKMYAIGYDRQAQPVVYASLAKTVLDPTERQMVHLLYMVERTIDLLPAGLEKITIAVDLSGKIPTSVAAMGVARSALDALQSHYPERLGAACMLKMPWLGSLFVTLLLPFIDSYTRQKMWINPDLTKEMIHPEQVVEEFGGKIPFEYTPEYMSALVDLCVKRKEKNLTRWRAAGSKIGTSEWDFLERFAVEDSNVVETKAEVVPSAIVPELSS